MKKTKTVLRVKQLVKKFKSKNKEGNKKIVRAVDEISFALKEGEILGLLGPNGAGKTTTIQMLLSILTPTSGSIEYFGKNLEENRSEILQKVSFASTYINLPWRLTVKENLEVYARLYGLNLKTFRQRVDAFLEHFDILDQKNKKFSSLSAGQRTRVMLVKSFLSYPKIVLLDEPTASLDPEVAAQVRSFVLKQRQKYNVSILFTSHNMNEVAEVCDRIMFLRKGRILEIDTPENLVSRIKQTHLKLNVGDGMKRTIAVARKMNLDYQQDCREIAIKLKEKDIAHFLNSLAEEKVDYKDINIVKPTLKDYFLKMSHK